MKNGILCLLCLLVMATTELPAQGFIKGLKKKIESVVKADSTATVKTNDANKANGYNLDGSVDIGLQPASAQVVDDEPEPEPASGNTAEELLRQLPPLISAELLLRPEENGEARKAYFTRIRAVELRFNALSQIEAENTRQAIERSGGVEAMKQKSINDMTAATGLSQAEMMEMGDESTSDARRQELEAKMKQNLSAKFTRQTGLTPEQMKQMEGMSDKEKEEYIRKNGDMSKIQAAARRANAKYGNSGPVPTTDPEAIKRMQNRLDSYNATLKAIKQTAARYTDQLSKGYEQLYRTASPTERDAITDRLHPISEQCRRETVEMWRKAHQQAVDDAHALVPIFKYSDTQSAKQIGWEHPEQSQGGALGMAGLCIHDLRAVADFTPIGVEIQPARRAVLYRDIAGFEHQESHLGFIPGASSQAGNNAIGCGSFRASEFVVFDDENHYFILSDGERRGPYQSAPEAMKNLRKKSLLKGDPRQKEWRSASGKRFVRLIDDYTLLMDDGSQLRYPLAIYACDEFVYWLAYEEGCIVEYSYRL